MSKLFMIVSVALLVSTAACMEKAGEITDPASDTVAEVQSNLVIADPCGDKLAADNAACTADYNACMSQAQTWWDKAACAVTRAACMTAAAAKYVGCIRSLLQPTQSQPVPAPGTPIEVPGGLHTTPASATSWLEGASGAPGVSLALDAPPGCAS